jgi:hypothetical protein
VLRLLAEATPVVLAVDDVHWVDRASARVLSFALRRLGREPVGVLVTERRHDPIEDPLPLGDTLAELGASRIDLSPLGMDSLDHLLRLRTATPLPRPTLARLHEASGGNPMYALEFARALSDSMPVDALPMPRSLRALVRDRIALLPIGLRPLLEVVAVLGHPTHDLLQRVSGGPVDVSLEGAVAAGALVVDDGCVRFSHPLLASAVSADTSPIRRRALHRAAADVIADEEESARHLALAAAGPDDEVASALDRAAARAHGRGAPDAAAELAEWAQRLTRPEQRPDRDRRVIQAAGYLVEAGDEAGARRLLDPLLRGDIPDAVRAEALLVRASAEWNDRPAVLELLRSALEHARDEPRIRCEALIRYAFQAGHLSGDEVAAERWAREALALAEQVGDSGLREQAAALVLFVSAFRGRPAGGLPPEPPGVGDAQRTHAAVGTAEACRRRPPADVARPVGRGTRTARAGTRSCIRPRQ